MEKNNAIQLGEEVLIAPDLTGQSIWIKGEVIEIDTSNPFGAVVAARSAVDNDVFFGREYAFRRTKVCLQ
ncbi:MAG: transcriptional regulator [Tannerella sp.]|nr:transcriptional regulator [Tannerella sp.]